MSNLKGKWATYYGDTVRIIEDDETSNEVEVSVWATGDHEFIERDELENVRTRR